MQSEKNGKIIINVKFISNKILILLNNNETLEINDEIFSKYYLYPNKELSLDDYNSIKFDILVNKNKLYCVNLLSKKQYSENQIKDKLINKGCNEKEIDYIINYLNQSNLLNDEAYINFLFDEYNKKLYGKQKIISRLYQTKFKEELIKNLNFDEESEKEKASKLIKIYLNKNNKLSYSKAKGKAYLYLLQNGYSSSISNLITNKEFNSIEINEIENLYNQIEKYIIIHKINLNDELQVKKIINRYLSKGFKYQDINKCLEDYKWKNL